MPPKKKIVSRLDSTRQAKKKEVAKKVVKKPPVVKAEVKPSLPSKYVEAVGRRKTSVARVRIFPDSPFAISINQKKYSEYFPTFELQNIVDSPISRANIKKDFSVSVKVNGGGIHSQAEAVRHGISRVLEKIDPALRKTLKPFGFLKRDPRMKERRKFGLKKARKAPQWAKR